MMSAPANPWRRYYEQITSSLHNCTSLAITHPQSIDYAKSAAKGLFTTGACLTLALLTFSGGLSLGPLWFAGVSTILSVGYEGQIFWDNIKDSLDRNIDEDAMATLLDKVTENYFKDFKINSSQKIENQLGGFSSLNRNSAKQSALAKIPPFIYAYRRQQEVIATLDHIACPEPEHTSHLAYAHYYRAAMIRLAIKKVSIASSEETNPLAELLMLGAPEKNEISSESLNDHVQAISEQYNQHRATGHHRYGALAFSLLSGTALGLGTISLIIEALAALGLVGTLPFGVIIVLAILSGITYAFLTYNSAIGMLSNNPLAKLWQTPKTNENEPGYKRLLVKVVRAFLFTIAIALTFFTAGTWLTILRSSQNLPWIIQIIPAWIRVALMPVLIALGEGIFAIENIDETVDEIVGIEPWKDISFSKHINNGLSHYQTRLKDYCSKTRKEISQNPLRIPFIFFATLGLVVESSLVTIGFMLHVVSIGLKADQVPGIPALVCILMGALSEVAEDWHYFFGGAEHQCSGHNHNENLPVWMIRAILMPLKYVTALLDYLTSGDANSFDTLITRSKNILTLKAVNLNPNTTLGPDSTPTPCQQKIPFSDNPTLDKALAISELEDAQSCYRGTTKHEDYKKLVTDLTNLKDPKGSEEVFKKARESSLKTPRHYLSPHKETASISFVEKLRATFFTGWQTEIETTCSSCRPKPS